MAADSRWENQTLDLAAHTAVQDSGRVKPLATFARFTLIQLSGRASAMNTDGETISPLEWILDTLFFPDHAQHYPVFLIENPEVMDALKLLHDRPRQRFAFSTLAPVRDHLGRLAMQYAQIDQADQTPAQQQIVRLAHNFRLYESLAQTLDFARGRLATMTSAAPVLKIIPPASGAQEGGTWLSPAEAVQLALIGNDLATAQTSALRTLRAMEEAKHDQAGLRESLLELHRAVDELAAGDTAKVPVEVHFYRVDPFKWALILYLAAFLLATLTWFAPQNRGLYRIALLGVLPPLAFHVYGIVIRCLIRERPPVTTLYETILFVSAVVVTVGLCLELVNRRRVALSLICILGAIGLFLAGRYEAMDGQDTMPALIAVLDTNFWLATHVTTVTIGYAAGLLAGALAHVYLLGWALGFKKDDPVFYASLTRAVYGVMCFCLLFATVGTVLGGIWANDSWGRFWGWDPKENGALMIVLWGLAVLHARLGGYIREAGIHMAAVGLGIIVAFSWFGVNLLGIGLHSYGFTTGLHRALTLFYIIESAVLLVGAFTILFRPSPGSSPAPPEPSPGTDTG
jgi:ABC-type transport system involved in cytochrome c biogenesis permease subunit